MRGDGGVADEGRVVAVPKFHSCGKCTVTLTNGPFDRKLVFKVISGNLHIYALNYNEQSNHTPRC